MFKSSEQSMYYILCYSRYSTEEITVISSVQIEHYIVEICPPIVITSVIVVCVGVFEPDLEVNVQSGWFSQGFSVGVLWYLLSLVHPIHTYLLHIKRSIKGKFFYVLLTSRRLDSSL